MLSECSGRGSNPHALKGQGILSQSPAPESPPNQTVESSHSVAYNSSKSHSRATTLATTGLVNLDVREHLDWCGRPAAAA
jgi:hypothetical protein